MWVHIVVFLVVLAGVVGWKTGWIPLDGLGGVKGIRLFLIVAVLGNLLGMIVTVRNNGQNLNPNRLEKETTGAYEEEFLVSVDGKDAIAVQIQVPEKESEDSEEEPLPTEKPDKQEEERQALLEAVAARNQEKNDPDYYYLPEEWEGKKLKWERPKDNSGALLAFLFLTAAFAVIVMQGREEQKEKQKRHEALLMDYPGLIMQFTLLIQAGMTVGKTFRKIARDYQRRREKNPRPAYEEVLTVCYEMDSGVSEAEAYRRFAERCGQVNYKTFATLLIQNLQKGSRFLADMLEQEATQAWDERKRKARVLGEAAATKLLVPMMMMLVVVMALIMIPAFLSFYGGM